MKLSLRTSAVLSLAVLTTSAFAQLNAIQVGTGMSQLTGAYGDPLNPNKYYAVQKTGQIIPVTNGVVGAPIATVTGIDTTGERGLLGLAFDPNYAANGRVYLSYVNNTTKALDVIRTNNFNLATAQLIISVPHPTNASNHYGGNIRFGGDGMFYIGMGDGGGGNDPENDAQNINNMLGKIMRIDVSGNGTGYGIPTDNPFVNAAGLDEIWAYGLRNPFKFSFDTNGELYIGDVGQDAWEEVDRMAGNIGGVNYGWQALEGTHANPFAVAPPAANAVPPIFEYSHSVGESITGGFVYRGAGLGSHYVGRYFFADFITKRLFSIDPNATNVALSLEEYTAGLGATISFTGIEPDANGEILLTNFGGSVYRLQSVPEPATMVAIGLGLAALIKKRKKN